MRRLSAMLPFVVVAWLCAAAQRHTPAPVVLISIDGLKPEYVLEADKHGLKIPHLRRFVKEGAFASGVTGSRRR